MYSGFLHVVFNFQIDSLGSSGPGDSVLVQIPRGVRELAPRRPGESARLGTVTSVDRFDIWIQTKRKLGRQVSMLLRLFPICNLQVLLGSFRLFLFYFHS